MDSEGLPGESIQAVLHGIGRNAQSPAYSTTA